MVFPARFFRRVAALFPLVVFALAALAPGLRAQTTISNPVGAPGTSNFSVSASQFVGARFTFPSAVRIVSLSVEFNSGTGGIFVAAVPLASVADLPAGPTTVAAPFAPGEVYASAVANVSGSGMQTLPVGVDLPGGTYAIVLGSGTLGATGSASVKTFGAAAGGTSLYRTTPPSSSPLWATLTSTQFNIAATYVPITAVAPAITLQPTSAAAAAVTGNTTFRVAASGTPAPTLQWERRAPGAAMGTPGARRFGVRRVLR